MHRQPSRGQLLQVLADLVAVHGPTCPLQEPQNYEGASAGIQFFLEFAICGFGVQFWLIPSQASDDCYVLISYR